MAVEQGVIYQPAGTLIPLNRTTNTEKRDKYKQKEQIDLNKKLAANVVRTIIHFAPPIRPILPILLT